MNTKPRKKEKKEQENTEKNKQKITKIIFFRENDSKKSFLRKLSTENHCYT